MVTGGTIRHAAPPIIPPPPHHPPPAVCAEKTLDPFRTREVTDVMPRVFTHLQQRGEKCVQEYIILKIFERNDIGIGVAAKK